MPRRTKPLTERFAMKVKRDPATGCLLWTAATNSKGYGRIRNEHGKNELAHRVAWRLSGRTLDPALELDHLRWKCSSVLCVDVTHLEQVTHRVNVARGRCPAAERHRAGICGRGHPMTADHGTRRNGKWACNTCRQMTRTPQLGVVRAWALSEGIPVKARGRVPAEVYRRFEVATSQKVSA
jgi:hypothetical protein